MREPKRRISKLCMVIAALALAAGWAAFANAQEGQKPDYESSEEFEKSKEDFGKNDEEKPPVSIRLGKEEKTERPDFNRNGSWGGWGGPMVGYLALDLSGLDPMTKDRDISGLNENMTVIGGMGGLAYSPADKKGWWRFGGMGFGGEESESERVGGETRKAKISIGGGGLFVEYHHPVMSRLDLGVGGLLGAGSVTLKAEGEDLGIDDDDTWKESEAFWFGYPYAGVSLKIINWLRLEATAGYLFMDADITGADYVIDDSDIEMTDEDIGGGMQYMVRLLFGFQPEK